MSKGTLKAFLFLLGVGGYLPAPVRAESAMKAVPGGVFEPLFKSGLPGQAVSTATVAPFLIDVAPVTNEDFARFVGANPQWRRSRVAPLFADGRYLSHWLTDSAFGLPERPVVNVSWHAAKAYCSAIGSRLPTDYEWQFAAYEGISDYAERLVEWYSKPASASLPKVKSAMPNRFGIYDLYGPIWEWVGDFNSLMIADDGRAGGSDSAQFCGAGAASATEARNYIGFMRAAYLSSLKASYTTNSLGFRCARDFKKGKI